MSSHSSQPDAEVQAETAPPTVPTSTSEETPGFQSTKTQCGPAASRTSSFSSVRSSSCTHKGKHAEPGITEIHADHASLSMPPPASRPARNPRAALAQNRCDSDNSEVLNDDASSLQSHGLEPTTLSGASSLVDVAAANDGTEEFDTPRLVPGAFPDKLQERDLPGPSMPSSRSSFSETDKKRMSTSSIYSMASARGVPSSAASVIGSDNGSVGNARSVSGFMASPVGKLGETGISNVTVTTGSQGSQGGNLAPREHAHHHLPDILKRTHGHGQISRPDPIGTSRSQPNRERSRAKRRLSGSTAASSHSPSSDRTVPHREREKDEGASIPTANSTVKSLTGSVAKPAPLGLIGVCALDVKARSKPSRNILNRLLANREFDVKIFGDKVILDEGVFRIQSIVCWCYLLTCVPLQILRTGLCGK